MKPLPDLTAVALVVFGLGCSAARGFDDGNAPATGRAGAGGAAHDAGADAPATGGARADGAAAAGCPYAPAPLRTTGAVLALSITPALAGAPFVFGEPNALPGGATVTPLNFRFYVSHVAVLGAGGVPVPVDLVTAAGDVEPYDVHLFAADDPASAVVRVLAPPGTYTGITFTLGLDDACNSGLPGERRPPLTDTSQLTWPVAAGYLFLRLEDKVDLGSGDGGTADAGAAIADAGVAIADAGGAIADAGGAGDASAGGGAAAIPPAIHMGGTPGQLFAPTVTVRGALTLAVGAPTTRALSLDVGQIFAGAEAQADPATLAQVRLPFPEVVAGEALREHVPMLALFALSP
jgi:hypothetical protein